MINFSLIGLPVQNIKNVNKNTTQQTKDFSKIAKNFIMASAMFLPLSVIATGNNNSTNKDSVNIEQNYFAPKYNNCPSTNDSNTLTLNDTIKKTKRYENPKYILSKEQLSKAPSPEITIAGNKENAGIVIDVNNNKLYRYNKDGSVRDGYVITTGIIDRNNKSITPAGIRVVDHIETYPYEKAYGTKRKRTPDPYGPKILYLTILDPKTGKNLGSDGIFLHGNNKESDLGKHKSHGCIRLPNEQALKFAEEVPIGTKIKIINN